MYLRSFRRGSSNLRHAPRTSRHPARSEISAEGEKGRALPGDLLEYLISQITQGDPPARLRPPLSRRFGLQYRAADGRSRSLSLSRSIKYREDGGNIGSYRSSKASLAPSRVSFHFPFSPSRHGGQISILIFPPAFFFPLFRAGRLPPSVPAPSSLFFIKCRTGCETRRPERKCGPSFLTPQGHPPRISPMIHPELSAFPSPRSRPLIF